MTVATVNDAPVLDNTGTMTLTTITEDQTTNSGQTVADILLSAGGDRITDVDSGAIEESPSPPPPTGTAPGSTRPIVVRPGRHVGSVSNASALLLRSSDLLRFVPNGENATSGDITFELGIRPAQRLDNRVPRSMCQPMAAVQPSVQLPKLLPSP